ncbi:hypothetical protein LIER_16437 [Lithospermum erythrorhizon]|uniref:Endonuclease/exonuclease/phosphatase domain-containing protein n=1 Tax=Lithospermum erythrorhizon TaxID=34254 RepID=A0AAV3Q833_LITER
MGLLWDVTKVDCVILEKGIQHLHLQVLCKETQTRLLWEHLIALGPSISESWVILGDFNCYASPLEKVGATNFRVKDLKNCMDSIGLVDAPSSSLRFTWSFKNLLTKLDRVLMNQEWNNLGYLGKIFYDSAQFKLCIKLKAMKKPLQILNRKEFGGISQKASSAKVEFQEVFNCLVEDPDNVSLREKVDILKKASKSLSESELSFLKQKAKCQHLLEADKGTKYYHALINKNGARSHISYIVKEDGSKITSYMEMADLFVEFYKGLFGTRRLSEPIDLGILGKGPCVPCDDTYGLVAPITREEIKATLWEMDGDKAPGPDGFSSTFFKAN